MHLLGLSNWLMGLINPNGGSISGSKEEGWVFWERLLFKKYGLLLAENRNEWALGWIGFCIGPVGCPCFVLEGLVLEAARDTLQLIAHSKEKKETPPAYGYSLLTFFKLASTKLEDAVLDADTHIKLTFRRTKVQHVYASQ